MPGMKSSPLLFPHVAYSDACEYRQHHKSYEQPIRVTESEH